MQRLCKIFIFLPFLFLVACRSSMGKLEQDADAQIDHVVSALQTGEMQQLWDAVGEKDKTAFFIFSNHQLVFWSDNSILLSSIPPIDTQSGWKDYHFDNADARIKWTDTGPMQILAVIPTTWHLRGQQVLEQSFSYQSLRSTSSAPWWQVTRFRVQAYFFFLAFLCVLLLAVVGWLLWKYHGFDNLRLRNKVQVILTISLVCFCAVVVFSILRFERTRYMDQQARFLQEKCLHVQSSLQSLYYWDFFLSSFHTEGLNIDLRDLAHTYKLDIHVYDMDGNLIGSSTPQLFQEGLLDPRMAPQVLFSNQSTQLIHEQIGKVKYMTAYTEFYNGSHVQIGYISMPFFVSEEARDAEVDALMARLLPPFIGVWVLMLLLSYFFAHSLTQPLGEMAEKMKHFSPNTKNNHIDYAYHDEIGQLVEHYNEMVDRLEDYTSRLAASERDSAWRTMARQIAHEINNPLTPMKLLIQQLQRTQGSPHFEEQFARVSQMLVEQIDNLSRIASSFSTFAKMPEVRVSWVDVAERLRTSMGLYAHNDANIPIRYVGPDQGVMVKADHEQIVQVFSNIIKNALQALAENENGDIIIRLESLSNEVCISFSDNGPGIPPEVQERIFTPNFTTKSTGAGLGLAISKNIVESCGGRISFESSKKGTIFFVYMKKKQ